MARNQSNLTEKEKLLFQKVQEGNEDEVKTLLSSDDVRVDPLDEHGMTPLQHAAYRGNYRLCKLFLDRGADVNSNHHDSSYTALMFAGLAGKLDVVSLLLEHGASTTDVNSVGRNAAQMAAFVGNHDVVTIINNFIPREEVEYFTVTHGLEKEPKLPPELATLLYRFVLKTNIHPVKLALYLQQYRSLLENGKKVLKVLELMCENQIKRSDINEILSLKFHHLGFVFKICEKYYREHKGEKDNPQILEPLIKNWIKGREEDGFPIVLEKLLRQSVREFPFRDSSVFQQLVRTLAPVEIGQEPSAISILGQAINGQRGYEEAVMCSACGEPKAEKRCSICKSAQYCDKSCQKRHWFTHKKQCPKLTTQYKKCEDENQEEERNLKKDENDIPENSQTESTSVAPQDDKSVSTKMSEEFSEKCSMKDVSLSVE